MIPKSLKTNAKTFLVHFGCEMVYSIHWIFRVAWDPLEEALC
jgi:hypothetical protein